MIHQNTRQTGFTLIELLVVIAIIGIVAIVIAIVIVAPAGHIIGPR